MELSKKFCSIKNTTNPLLLKGLQSKATQNVQMYAIIMESFLDSSRNETLSGVNQ